MNDAKEGYQTYVVGPVKQRWNLGGLGGKMIPVVTCYYNYCRFLGKLVGKLSLYFHTCPYSSNFLMSVTINSCKSTNYNA